MSKMLSGYELILNNDLNKDLAFTEAERKKLYLQGILPPLILKISQQEKLFLHNLTEKSNSLEKYLYLMNLRCRNHLKFSGLFITIDEQSNIENILSRWPEKNVKAICVTDGERILGLGDLGANGMGIPIGKLALYTALGGVDPSYCLPITLDVGTNNKELLEDEFYIGLKKERVSNEEYENFVDEFMQACVKIYGSEVLIQFEDFGNHYAFYFLQKYRLSYCMFNDDIQGTAAVVIGGIINATKIIDKRISENVFLFFGAGEAALGIASLLVMIMKDDGLSDEEARKIIYLVDSKGLVVEDRPSGNLTPIKSLFAQKMEPLKSLLEIIKKVSPSVLIGASGQNGSFNSDVLKAMREINNQPIIMALSNPTSKSECTAEEAYTYTKGSAIFSSGSPFDPFQYEDQLLVPGQANNSYIFPGVAFSIIHCKINPIQDKLFLEAAKGLAKKVSPEDLKSGKIYPNLREIEEVSLAVALAVCEYGYRSNTANFRPEPEDKKAFLRERYYKPIYENFVSKKDKTK